jgi:hypothetical protein
VNISDIATGEFPEALEGVNAVIHTASPLPNRAPADVILKVTSPLSLSGFTN